MTYKTENEIENYMNEILLKSATFDFNKFSSISTNKIESGVYFTKINTKQSIYHLIYSNQGSKAGDIYNKFTINFIEKSCRQAIKIEDYDIIEALKNKFIELSDIII